MKKLILFTLVIGMLMCITGVTLAEEEEGFGTVSCDLYTYKPAFAEKSEDVVYNKDFREQLTEYERKIYDRRLQRINTFKKGSVAQVEIPLLPDIHRDDIDTLTTAAFGAAYAFEYDHPEYFWLSKYVVVGYSYDKSTGIITHLYYMRPDDGWWCNAYSSYSEVLEAEEAFDKEVKNILADANDLNLYDTIKFFHDELADRNEYNKYVAEGATFDDIPQLAWCAASAIIPHSSKKYDPVCEGYAKAFKVLCDRSNIDCVLINGDAGGPHMWNMVKMHNGEWFYIDLTFNDSSNTLSYDYFLKGSRVMHRTHTPEGAVTTFELFTYPIACSRDYPQRTGGFLGDANLDETINTSDAVSILKYAADMISLNSSSKQRADFNCDGYINTGDATRLLEYIAEN